MNTLFFRLLSHEDKATALSEAIAAVCEGGALNSVVHAVDPVSFRQMPGSPFAYWASERVRQLFTALPPFEGEGRTVRVGLQTSDDFRFVRAWWEVPSVRILDGANGPDWREDTATFQAWCRQRTFAGKRWVPFAKGGAYSPYYADLHLVVDWERDGEEMKAWADPLYGNSGWSRIIKSVDFYFRPGLTWPLRTNGLSFRAVPVGCLFGHKGPMAFVLSDNRATLRTLAAVMNSTGFYLLVQMLVARVSLAQSFEVGLVQSIPIPDLSIPTGGQLSELAWSAMTLKQTLDTIDETSHVFVLPALLQGAGDALAERIQPWARRVTGTAGKLTDLQQQIDAVAYQLYGIGEESQRAIHVLPEEESTTVDGDDDEEALAVESASATDSRGLITDLLSFVLGTALGRWDIRYATHQRPCPELPDPFAPLPVCSPGMLSQANGLPAGPEDVSGDYPLRISWPGILVDDEGHPEDIIGRVREAMEVLWPERASDIEHEACEILGARSLRDYFARPHHFFAAHLKRYSKSRRQAPIYWPLQTPSGSYTLWLYTHRLTDQTLYTCVNDFVGPRLKQLTEQLDALRIRTGRSKQEERELERLLDFEQELTEFRDELLRVARFWKPNLNDGVQITAAPLWKLFQHRPWQKTLQDTWDKLAHGAYDWAHLAYSIWPERVREKCQHDKSLAIAHGLEELYKAPPVQPRKKRGRTRE